eukprot:GHVT01008533.1.p1 GENE.GHVT01008533.1~~GHVT01008533.1.p1  ORF type:complete len:164 (+),score=12.62 GHVT01008533.1:426-917(+)
MEVSALAMTNADELICIKCNCSSWRLPRPHGIIVGQRTSLPATPAIKSLGMAMPSDRVATRPATTNLTSHLPRVHFLTSRSALPPYHAAFAPRAPAWAHLAYGSKVALADLRIARQAGNGEFVNELGRTPKDDIYSLFCAFFGVGEFIRHCHFVCDAQSVFFS